MENAETGLMVAITGLQESVWELEYVANVEAFAMRADHSQRQIMIVHLKASK